jgi:O-antigen ligase
MQVSSEFFPANTVASRSSQITSSRSNQAQAVSPPVRWAFYAFVFSILFEEASMPIPLEVIHITGGFLVMAVFFIQPGLGLRRPPAAFWCFVIYTCVGIGTLLYYRQFFDEEILSKQFKSFQLILLFWIAYNLMRNERTARGALISLVASCAVLSVLQVFGLTSTTEKVLSKTSRFSAFGLGPGQLAGVLSLGLLACFGLVHGIKKVSVTPRFLIWPAFALIGMTVVKTGSRGPLIALAAGFLVFTLRRGTFVTKLRNTFVVLLGVGLFLWIASYSEIVRHRFEVTIEDGNVSAREKIYPMAIQMFLERPLVGWGPVANTWELGNRVQIPRYERLDTHNLVLYVVTSTGIMGAIPFFIGVGLCLRGAFKARGAAHGVLPLAMTVSVLVADMSSSGLHWKQHWLILAYALASAAFLRPQSVQPVLATRISKTGT